MRQISSRPSRRNLIERQHCRKCRGRLPAPTDNHHHAFCTRDCHSSFYWSRCLVCEEEMRRKTDRQRFKSGHNRCKADFRAFPHAFEYPRRGYVVSARTPVKTSIKPLCFWPDAGGRGWRWEDERDLGEIRLFNREDQVVARLWLVGSVWYLLKPKTIPVQTATDVESAKRVALSMALATLPLDEATAKKVERENARTPILKSAEIIWSRPVIGGNFRIRESKTAGDPGPIPDFLDRAGWRAWPPATDDAVTAGRKQRSEH